MSQTNGSLVSAAASPVQNEDANNEDFDIESITRQAGTTIVLHPGSSHLRIGRASDPQPILIPHVIAWRHKNPGSQKCQRKSLLSRELCEYENNRDALNLEGLKLVDDAIERYTGRKSCPWEQVAKSNKKKKHEILREGCGWAWTETNKKLDILIGDDALYMDENDWYDLHWPIVKGQLNVHKGSHGSLTSVIADLEALWTVAIESFLKISRKELINYRCVLLIPDIYIHNHVKELVHMIINKMGFASVLVHQESVCATYGCGIATGCVVDVGHEKTAISCIEDGISHKNTRICLDVGGRDITRAFAHLLKQNYFPYSTFDPNDRMDALLMEELKETFCHMEPDRVAPENQEFHIRRPGQNSQLYSLMLGDETLQAPLSLFFPKVLGLLMNGLHLHFIVRNPGDSEDPCDEHYLHQTRSKQVEARASRREKAIAQTTIPTTSLDDTMEKLEDENGEDLFDEESAMSQSSSMKQIAEKVPQPSGLLGLDNAIIWSIENCPLSYEDEVKRRMYACILVVGGGLAHFAGAEQFLTHRIKAAIPVGISQSLMVSQVDVLVKPKGQDPTTVVWKGGSVLSCLENAQELWISREDWQKHGLKVLRERAPFVW